MTSARENVDVVHGSLRSQGRRLSDNSSLRKVEASFNVPCMYYVYILASRRHGTLYIGVTNDVRNRLEQHRSGKGSSFVKAYGVHRLVYVEAYERADEAIAREK